MERQINEQYYEYCGEYWRCSFDEILDFCADKQIYLYGAGTYGKFMYEQLQKLNREIEGFLVTDKSVSVKNVCGKSVIGIDEFTYEPATMAIVICTENYVNAMKNKLEEKGITEYQVLCVSFKKPMVKGELDANLKAGYLSNMDDGLLRIRITHKCPGKCDFCGQLMWSLEEQNREMDPKWYFKYMLPLYEKIKVALITGGDSFFSTHSYELMELLSREYPHVTIMTESDGLPFNEKFQKLACDNLFLTHFSINASNVNTFVKGCWSSAGGEKAFAKIMDNMKQYVDRLDAEGKMCFAPNISMVINKNTADDVIPFLKYTLAMRASYVTYYFDYRENDMDEDYFQDPATGRMALRQLMEIERVLEGKLFISFRLWTPLKEIGMMEKELEHVSIEELREKYSDLLELTKERSIEKENAERNRIRRQQGKKELTLNEDFSFTMQSHTVEGKQVCKAAWKVLDVYPNGRMDFCSWHVPTLYLPDFIKDDKVDWESVFNSKEYCTCRCNMLKGDYTGCMKCCPIIRDVDGGFGGEV